MFFDTDWRRMKTVFGPRNGHSERHPRRYLRPLLESLEKRHMLSTFAHLDPGGPANLVEEVPVNIVFVGYEPTMFNEADFRAWLPSFHNPTVRTNRQQVGLHYTYDYELTYTDQAFEDAFFGELTDLAVLQFAPGNHTFFQELYNQQATNSVEIIQNYLIDAPSVEKWLAANPPPGVDTTENTLFFVNWWGRDDFKFHVYLDNHDPNPDSGFVRGNYEVSTRMAFGGTTQDDEETGLGNLGTHRIWVHDLSAGPDSFTGNWNVDNADKNGNGFTDEFLPPVWDYFARFSPEALGADLGVVARFVAIDAIFTASPVFPPYLTFPELPTSINLDINVYDGWPRADASEIAVRPEVVLAEVNELFRLPMTVDVQDLKYEGEARAALEDMSKGIPHFKEHGNNQANANLFYQEALNLDERLDGGGDYEAVAAIYAVDDRQLESLDGIAGVAYTNFQDGTQSFVFAFVAPRSFRPFGLPATETLIHEYGHHFGLNHPHEGYDSEFNFFFHPEIRGFQFVYTGTETNSVMGYNLLNNDFSQWDHDNFNRFWAAGYIKAANAIAANILASPNAAAAETFLAAADALIGLAKEAVAEHDYRGAFDQALLAYGQVRAAASAAGVAVVGTQIGRQIPPHARGLKTEHSSTGLKTEHSSTGFTIPLSHPLKGSSGASAMLASWAAMTLPTQQTDRSPARFEDVAQPINDLPLATRGSRGRVEPAAGLDAKRRLDGSDLDAKDGSARPGSSQLGEFDLALHSLLTEFEQIIGDEWIRDLD